MTQDQAPARVPLTTGPEASRLGKNVEQIPATTSLAEMHKVFDRDGIFCLTDAIDPDTLAKANEFLDPLLDRSKIGERAWTTDRNRLGEMIGVAEKPHEKPKRILSNRIGRVDVMAMAPDLMESFIAHPRIVEFAESELLGEYAETMLIHQALASELHPGAERQDFHRDGAALWKIPGIQIPKGLIAAAVLRDFTAETGATELILGSHRWPEAIYFDPRKEEGGWNRLMNPVRAPEPDEITTLEAPVGSIVIWHGNLFHRGGANTSESGIRRVIASGYCLGWLRGEINQQLVWPPEVAKSFSPRLQKLIGYRLENHFIGGLELGQDPSILLRDDASNPI